MFTLHRLADLLVPQFPKFSIGESNDTCPNIPMKTGTESLLAVILVHFGGAVQSWTLRGSLVLPHLRPTHHT